jgi:hypothetical protein
VCRHPSSRPSVISKTCLRDGRCCVTGRISGSDSGTCGGAAMLVASGHDEPRRLDAQSSLELQHPNLRRTPPEPFDLHKELAPPKIVALNVEEAVRPAVSQRPAWNQFSPQIKDPGDEPTNGIGLARRKSDSPASSDRRPSAWSHGQGPWRGSHFAWGRCPWWDNTPQNITKATSWT